MRPFLLTGCLAVAAILTVSAGHAERLIACGLNIDYKIEQPPANADPESVALLGVWVGEWKRFPFVGGGMRSSSPYCAGLVVQRINPDQTASAVYFIGRNPEWQIAEPKKSIWNKVSISHGVLNLTDRSSGLSIDFQIDRRNPNRMDGTMRRVISGDFYRQQ